MGRIFIKIKPNAKLSKVHAIAPLTVHIAAAPEQGRANIALIFFLSLKLGVPKSTITIIRGHTTKQKLIEIDNLDEPTILARLSRGLQASLL